MSGTVSEQNPIPALSSEVSQRITEALSGLRFGAVEITVHDGFVVQIERREKYRFDPRSRG